MTGNSDHKVPCDESDDDESDDESDDDVGSIQMLGEDAESERGRGWMGTG